MPILPEGKAVRYTLQHKKSGFITFLVVLFSLSVYTFITGFIFYKYLSDSLFSNDIVFQINGNPDIFMEGMELLQIIEMLHIEGFLLSMLFLTVFSINLRTLLPENLKVLLIMAGFISTGFYLLAPFGIKYISQLWGYVYTAGLLLSSLILVAVNTVNLYSFITGKLK